MKEKFQSQANKLYISNNFEATVFAAELGETVSIDLHGLHVDEAKAQLENFLHHEFMEGTEVVKIIHGRGTMKLKEAVQQLLEKESIVEYFRQSQNPSEMNAVAYAVLSKRK